MFCLLWLHFLVRVLANDLDVYAAVLQEHEEIATGKLPGEFLTWEDLAKMKYTWRVALETLRTVPPWGRFLPSLLASELHWKTLNLVDTLSLKGGRYSGLQARPTWTIPYSRNQQSLIQHNLKTKHQSHPYCFIPFGGGPQICPGIEFARIETLVAIHHLVTRFKWKLHHTNNFFSRNPTPEPTEGLPVKIIPRA